MRTSDFVIGKQLWKYQGRWEAMNFGRAQRRNEIPGGTGGGDEISPRVQGYLLFTGKWRRKLLPDSIKALKDRLR